MLEEEFPPFFLSMWHTLKDPWNIKINRKLDLQNLSAKPGITFLAAVSNRHPGTCKTLTKTPLPPELSAKTTASTRTHPWKSKYIKARSCFTLLAFTPTKGECSEHILLCNCNFFSIPAIIADLRIRRPQRARCEGRRLSGCSKRNVRKPPDLKAHFLLTLITACFQWGMSNLVFDRALPAWEVGQFWGCLILPDVVKHRVPMRQRPLSRLQMDPSRCYRDAGPVSSIPQRHVGFNSHHTSTHKDRAGLVCDSPRKSVALPGTEHRSEGWVFIFCMVDLPVSPASF